MTSLPFLFKKISSGAIALLALFVFLLANCQPSYAQSTPTPPAPATTPQSGPGPNFADHQKKELDRIAAHIQVLQTLQSCVQAATDHAGIKACNQTAKASEHHK
jgi:hypothetical protein